MRRAVLLTALVFLSLLPSLHAQTDTTVRTITVRKLAPPLTRDTVRNTLDTTLPQLVVPDITPPGGFGRPWRNPCPDTIIRRGFLVLDTFYTIKGGRVLPDTVFLEIFVENKRKIRYWTTDDTLQIRKQRYEGKYGSYSFRLVGLDYIGSCRDGYICGTIKRPDYFREVGRFVLWPADRPLPPAGRRPSFY